MKLFTKESDTKCQSAEIGPIVQEFRCQESIGNFLAFQVLLQSPRGCEMWCHRCATTCDIIYVPKYICSNHPEAVSCGDGDLCSTNIADADENNHQSFIVGDVIVVVVLG